MYKQIIVVTIVAVLLCCLSSCDALIDAILYDEYYTKESLIELQRGEDDKGGYIDYQGNRYYGQQGIWSAIGGSTLEKKGGEYIGWIWNAMFRESVYCDTAENPVFLLLADRYIYLREDCDFQTEAFLVEGTEGTIRFCDDLQKVEPPHPDFTFYVCSKEVKLSLTKSPLLKIFIAVYNYNGVWYAQPNDTNTHFVLSDHFIETLQNSGAIQAK